MAILALTVFVIPVAAKSDGQSDVAGARAATASFHDLDAANAAGYAVRVADVNGITCIDNPGTGAMGVHYLDPSLVPELFDPNAAASVDASTPELLVYAPGTNGTPATGRARVPDHQGPAGTRSTPAPPSLFGQHVQRDRRRQPVRPAGLLQPACLDLGPEPDRPVLPVEPAGDLPVAPAVDQHRPERGGRRRPPRSRRRIRRPHRPGGYHPW